MERLQAGVDREELFRALVDRYQRTLYRFFEKRGFLPGECEDLVQETFLAVHQSLDGFRQQASLGTWVFQVAANIYRHSLRHRNAQKRSGQLVSLDARLATDPRPLVVEVAPAPQADPLRRYLAHEQLRTLRQALAEMTPRMRQCILLRAYQGLTYQEISVVLQISIQSVKIQIFRARHKLRQRLRKDFGDFNF